MNTKGFMKLAALIPLSLALVGCGKTTINVNDYLTLSCDGYDTVGNATYVLDYEQLVRDNLKAFKLEETANEMDIMSAAVAVDAVLEGALDKTDNITNGDTITFKWDESMDLTAFEELYPVKLEYSDETLEVSGLAQAEAFDPFDFVSVSYEGIAPSGSLRINVSNDILNGLQFTADKTEGLSNGDTVTITVTSTYGEDLASYCLTQGKLPSQTEKTFTVEGLSSYPMALSEIPADSLEKMDKHAQDCLNAYIAGEWDNPASCKNITMIGNYFLAPKDPSIYTYTKNYLYYVYKIDVENDVHTMSYYYYAYYTDLMLMEDGTCSLNLNNIVTPDGSAFFGSVFGDGFIQDDLFYVGFQDLDSMFYEQVTSKIDQYNYESTVTE